MSTRFEAHFAGKSEYTDARLTLGRIKRAVDAARIPTGRLNRIVHVAGTNGKGSTASFIEQLVRKAGKKTALYSSPHMHAITERICINGEQISEAALDAAFDALVDVIDEHGLTYFEALTLVALRIFSEAAPAVTILETGLGGTYDATNIFDDTVPVLTSIARDHEEFLGRDIKAIADEKLGIVKKNDEPVFVGPNQKFMREYILRKLPGRRIIFSDTAPAAAGEEHFPAIYRGNFRIARIIAAHVLDTEPPAGEFTLPPARLERFGNIILDVAHNPNGLLAMLSSLDEPPAAIVLTCTRERNLSRLAAAARQSRAKIFLTEIPDNDRSVRLAEVSVPCEARDADPLKMLDAARTAAGDGTVVVTGSMFLCGFIRRHIQDGAT